MEPSDGTVRLGMKILDRIKKQPKLGLLILAYVSFIALGMPDGLLGVAWPSIRVSFSLPLDALGSLLITGTTGYMISSFLSGRLIARLGVGRLLAISCATTGLALLGYTLVPSWWMMVSLGILAGLGAGAIDAGLNTYVATHFSAGLMQWLHASYGIGVAFGAFLMTVAVSEFQSWRVGYITVGSFQLALALCFALTLSMWNTSKGVADPGKPKQLTDYQTAIGETLRQPRVWLSMLLFFFYTGSEFTMGVWAYTLLTESRGIQPGTAGLLAGSFWAMFTIGRVIAGLYTGRIGVNRLLMGCFIGALVGAVLLWWNPTPLVNLLAMVVIGFAIAPIFPGLVSGTSQRVGARFAANTIGMQLAAAGLGGSLIPSLNGVLADHISLEVIPVCLIALFMVQIALFIVSQANPPEPAEVG